MKTYDNYLEDGERVVIDLSNGDQIVIDYDCEAKIQYKDFTGYVHDIKIPGVTP